jgi:hypothetical protein
MAASPTSTSSSRARRKGISAFIVEVGEVDASQRIEIVAPHPMATVRLKDARAELLGEPGQGFKLAMRGLDVFRTTVAGAALGFASPRARRGAREGTQPQDVRPDPGRLPDDPGEARGHGDRYRCRGAAHLSFGVEEGHRQPRG